MLTLEFLDSVLGFSRLQHGWLRRNREPAPKMHGWTSSPSSACEYNQLPPVADAEIRYQPKEAEINAITILFFKKKEEKKRFVASSKYASKRRCKWPCTMFPPANANAAQFESLYGMSRIGFGHKQ